jgi:NAD(P)-dependent dehydrogenase (short-subunit alcohol dehydrogenase family)
MASALRTEALVDEGAHVVAGSRTRGDQLVALEETGQVSFVPVDLSLPDAAEELVAAAAHRGGIDVLVNDVGVAAIRPGGFARITDDEWQASWDLNVMATVRPTRAALPEIERRGGGSMSSSARSTPISPSPRSTITAPPKPPSPISRRHYQKNWRQRTFESNSVSPGPVSTGLWTEEGRAADGFAKASGQTADDVRAMIANTTPTGRFNSPEQVADLVVFLASDRAGNTTGSDYRIDGGFVTTL